MPEQEMNERLDRLSHDKILEYTPAIIYVAIVVGFGVFGNVMSVTYYGFKCPRTPTNVIITALGVVDLLCCIVLSDEIIELCYTVTFKNVAGCKVMYVINHFLVFFAGTTLFFVGIDRYRKICRPFKWQFTLFRIKLAFAVIIAYSLAVSVRDFAIIDVVRVNVTMGTDVEPVRAYYCTHSNKHEIKTAITVFQIIDLLTFVVVVGGSIILYTMIAIKLWQTRRRVHGDGKTEDISVEIQNESTTMSTVEYTESDETSDRKKCDKSDLIPDDDTEESTLPPENETKIPPSEDLIEEFGKTENTLKEKEAVSDSDVENQNSKDNSKTQIPNKTADNENNRDNCNSVNDNERDDNDNSKKTKDLLSASPSKKKVFEARLNTIKKKVLKATTLTAEMKVEQKVTIMMLVITTISIISFVPYFVVNLGFKSGSETSEQEFSVGIQIALRSYILNNAVNPYIIGMFNSQFRLFVKDLFCKKIFRKR